MSGQSIATGPQSAPPRIPRAEQGASLSGDAFFRLLENKVAVAGGVCLVLMFLACFFGPILLGLDPTTTHLSQVRRPPNLTISGLFGTDNLGRSYLARVLVGGQTSLMVGIATTVVAVLIGVSVGAIAGYFGGKTDEIIMRWVDFLYGIPYMFLVILIMLMFANKARGSALPVFLALGVVQWLTVARIVRGQTMSLRNEEFVEAAKVVGAGDMRIIFRHIVPNLLGIVVVYATLTVPAVILLESFLSFLGLGVHLSWGVLVSEAVTVVNPIKGYWWLLFFPSLFLAITLFSLNYLGDGLRDVFDPRSGR